MKAMKTACISINIIAAAMIMAAGTTSFAEEKRGEQLFKEHCSACHPNGTNIVNPKKTLSKKDLQQNNVRSEDDIVKIMRNPGPGMLKFDEKTISDKNAHEIAEYVIKTFAK